MDPTGAAKLAVVSIDIGESQTSFSYGYCLDHSLYSNPAWGLDYGIPRAVSAPTSVLCVGQKRTFGYTAEIEYSEMVAEGRQEGATLHRHCGDKVWVSQNFVHYIEQDQR